MEMRKFPESNQLDSPGHGETYVSPVFVFLNRKSIGLL